MNKVYVGNLAAEITDAQLKDLAFPFGKLHSINIARHFSSGESKGFAFVEYSTADEARAAIAGLNGKDVSGRPLDVRDAGQRRGG